MNTSLVLLLALCLVVVKTYAQGPPRSPPAFRGYPPQAANVISGFMSNRFRPMQGRSCPPSACPRLRCPMGRVYNVFGCPTCVCRPMPRCPPVNCGNCQIIPGLNGCPACDCFKGPGVPNPPRQKTDQDN